MPGVDGGQHDQLSGMGVPVEITLEAGVGEHVDRVHRGLDRAVGRARQAAVARALGGQHVDAFGPERDGVRDRGIVGDPAVDQETAAPGDRRQHPGDCRGGEHGVGQRAVRQAHLGPGQQVKGDQVQWDGRLLQPLKLQVPFGQPAQRAAGDQMVVPTGQAADERGRAQREDVAATHPAPDGRQFFGGVHGRGPGGEERGIQGAGQVPMSRSGAMPRSYRARTIPACMAPREAPPASTNAVRGCPRSGGGG